MNAFLMKAVTLLFWVLAFVAWVQGWEGLLGYLPLVGVIVAGIHVVEVLFFWTVFRKKSTNVRLDAFLVFVFGIFHLQRFMPRQ